MSGIKIILKCNIYCKFILIAYILAYIGATYNHVMDIKNFGLFYHDLNTNVPLIVKTYWTLLTLADPISIIILLINARAGIISYTIIIVSDVIINILIALNLWGIHGLLNIGMICQFGFMVFLLTTYKSILNEIKRLIRLKTTDQSAFI